MSNNVKTFVLSNDYNWSFTKSYNKGRTSVEQLINEYLNPIRENIEFKIAILNRMLRVKENELQRSNFSSTIKLNIEIQSIKEQIEMLIEIYNQL